MAVGAQPQNPAAEGHRGPDQSDLNFRHIFEEVFSDRDNTYYPPARDDATATRIRVQIAPPPTLNINAGDNYPKQPIEESVVERLRGDLARTEGPTESVNIRERFNKYGSPALTAIAGVLETEEIRINDLQKSRENDPIDKRWVARIRKTAGNLLVIGGGFLAGLGMSTLLTPVAAVAGRAMFSGARAGIEYHNKATLEGAAQLYKQRVSSLDGKKNFLEHTRNILGQGEKIALESAFGVKDRDNKIMGLLNDGLSEEDPRFIRITSSGIENPAQIYDRLQELTGNNLEANNPNAATRLQRAEELLTDLYTQSILSGYSEHVSPEKIKAYADLVIMLSSTYQNSYERHSTLTRRNENRVSNIQQVWDNTKTQVNLLLRGNGWKYIAGAATGSLMKSAVFAGFGYALGAIWGSFRDGIDSANETATENIGAEMSGRSLITDGDYETNPIPAPTPGVQDFHDNARSAFDLEGDNYDNYLGIDERTHRMQFIEMISMARDGGDINEDLEMFHNFTSENDLTLSEIERAVIKGNIPEEWGINLDQARSIISAGKLEELIQQMMQLTGKSQEDITSMLANENFMAKIDNLAMKMNMSSDDLIKTLTLRGGIPSGQHSGVNILARLLTEQTTSSDIASLKQMLEYTGNVNNVFYRLTQDALNGAIVTNSADLPTVTISWPFNGTIDYVANANEIYPDLSGDFNHDEYMQQFRVIFENNIKDQSIENYLNNDPTYDPDKLRLERLAFFEMVDLAKDEESARYYLQLLQSVYKNGPAGTESINEVILGGNIPTSWGLTNQQEEILPTALRLQTFIRQLAEETSKTESTIIDELAGGYLPKQIESYAINSGFTRDEIIDSLMIKSELPSSNSASADQLLLRILSSTKASDADIAAINESLKYEPDVNKLWGEFARNIILKDGDEIASIQELGFTSLQEYYEAHGITETSLEADMVASSIANANSEVAGTLGYKFLWPLNAIPQFGAALGLAILETGDYNNRNSISASLTQQSPANNAPILQPTNTEGVRQFIESAPELFRREGDVTNGYFGSISAHSRYRWLQNENLSPESRGKGRFMNKETLIAWLRSDSQINDTANYPNLTSIISFAQNSLIPTVRDNDLRNRFSDMLTSEEGTIEMMKYLAVDLARNGDFDSAKKIYALRKHIIDKDPTILQVTVDRIKEREQRYVDFANMLQADPNQVSRPDRDFLRFYIMHHLQFEVDQRLLFPANWYQSIYTSNSFFVMI